MAELKVQCREAGAWVACVLLFGLRTCETLVWGSPLTLDTKGSVRVNIHSLGLSLSSFCHLGISVAV